MAVAALLGPAERELGADLHVAVHPHVAGSNVADHALRTAEVAGPNSGGQAVTTVVGDGDGLVLGVEGDDHGDRTEDLLLADLDGVVVGHEQRRLDPMAVG